MITPWHAKLTQETCQQSLDLGLLVSRASMALSEYKVCLTKPPYCHHIHVRDISPPMCSWGNKQVFDFKNGYVGISTQSCFREAVLRLVKYCTSYLCLLKHEKTVATALWHVPWKSALRENKCFGIQLVPAGLKHLPTALDTVCGAQSCTDGAVIWAPEHVFLFANLSRCCRIKRNTAGLSFGLRRDQLLA